MMKNMIFAFHLVNFATMETNYDDVNILTISQSYLIWPVYIRNCMVSATGMLHIAGKMLKEACVTRAVPA